MRRAPILCAAAATALALLSTSACGGSDVSGGGSGAGGTLTIQGDSGNPTLVENFNQQSVGCTLDTWHRGASISRAPVTSPA